MNTDNVVEFLRLLSLDVSLGAAAQHAASQADAPLALARLATAHGPALQRLRLVSIRPQLSGCPRQHGNRWFFRGRQDLAIGAGSRPGHQHAGQCHHPGHRHRHATRGAGGGRPRGQRPGAAPGAKRRPLSQRLLKPLSGSPGTAPRPRRQSRRWPCTRSAGSRLSGLPNPASRPRRTRPAPGATSGRAPTRRSTRPPPC